jgi:hypothetical protein
MSDENNQKKLNFFEVSDVYTACGIIEGFESIPDGVDSYTANVQAWQYLIDSGHAWTLQGWYGRNAHALIQDGVCKPPKS